MLSRHFITLFTQHIPEKGFHVVRYYARYPSRSMGQSGARREC
ncbi:MAG: transposase [Deltaproteobacteria bacterium]|nr:transposase [Deltaproteobacteria bacterium]